MFCVDQEHADQIHRALHNFKADIVRRLKRSGDEYVAHVSSDGRRLSDLLKVVAGAPATSAISVPGQLYPRQSVCLMDPWTLFGSPSIMAFVAEHA